jgi:hypothetical protein
MESPGGFLLERDNLVGAVVVVIECPSFLRLDVKSLVVLKSSVLWNLTCKDILVCGMFISCVLISGDTCEFKHIYILAKQLFNLCVVYS